MSNLVDHARYELERMGYLDADSDYGGMIGTAVLEIINTFAQQGHSGFSAAITTRILTHLLAYEPLSELTDDPAEWKKIDPSMTVNGEDLWQSKRWPAAFSTDGGKRYYDVEDDDRITHATQSAADTEPQQWRRYL